MQSFFDHAQRHPERRAVLLASGTEVSYGELAADMHRIAHALDREGLRPGDTVAVMMENRPEYLAVFGAAVESGLPFVGLNWHLTAEEIAYILTDSGARLLIASPTNAETAQSGAEQAGIPEAARVCLEPAEGFVSLAEFVAGQPEELPVQRQFGQALFYTSGTTGKPKGVRKKITPIPPERIRLSTGIGTPEPPDVDSAQPSDAVHLVAGPLYHAAPLAGAAAPLDMGAAVVLMERFTPEGFLELVERYRVTNAWMVPTMFNRLLALRDEVRATADVSSLQSIMHAGAPCAVEVKHRMIDWMGPILNEAYSSTEGAGTFITSEEWLRRPGSVGRPAVPGTVKILDGEGRECPPGVEGMVYLAPTLWEFEYLHDPKKTEETRRGGVFTVGDIGYLDEEGYLFLCDRVAEVIVSGAVNIYPAEIESVLQGHPAVADAAVVGVPNHEWGEEVRGIVELQDGWPQTPETGVALIEHCRSRLAHYKCPKAIDFVETLGRDPNGKLRKRVLRAPYWEGRERRI
jgi:long-chain acyl-CoA synthetase